MLVIALAIFVALIAVIVYKMFLTSEMCTCNTNMTGKVVLVTGANTGIGFETAKDLARRGAKVILACRDKAKGLAAKDEIINATRNKEVILKEVNLSSLSSVRALAEDILETEPKLHVLINNAGAGRLDNSLTEDNLAVEPQINHFSPFLLTVLLLPLLKSSAPSRIVNVSSIMHNRAKFNLDTFAKPAENDKEFSFVYSNCKLANILFTLKLSRMLQGTGVTANSLHPGAVSTNIFRNKNIFSRIIVKLLFMTPIEGAQTSIHLAVAPELARVSGKYFSKCSEVTPAKIARDYSLAEGLWELSERLVLDKKSQ